MNLKSVCDRAVGFHKKGQLAEAERLYLQILAVEPENFVACHMLGIIRHQQARDLEALELIGVALKINPSAADGLSNYGIVLKALGRPEEALASYDAALAIRPDYVTALYNRGIVLYDLNRLEAALASYDAALAVKPRDTETLNNRGNILWRLGYLEDALASYDIVLATNPNHAEALYNRGNTLRDLNRLAEALTSYEAALAFKPDNAAALNNRGMVLRDLGRLEDALASCNAALAIRPHFSDTLYNRGDVLLEMKRFQEALESFESARAANPGHLYSLSGAANAALHLCDWEQTAIFAGHIRAQMEQRKAIISPFVLLGYSSDALMQLQCARKFVQDRVPAAAQKLWTGKSRRHDRLRIAYMSTDFRHCALAHLMAELFERHDRSRFEVLGISIGRDDHSEIRARVEKAFDGFHDVQSESDRAVAELLHRLEVDILIDLNGHTRGARPKILSYRPAPVQATYMGFPATTGADFIDYVIADRIVLPFDQQPFFTEKIVHLPDSYWVNDSQQPIGPTPARSDCGLPERGFVFCCFNNNWKITAPVFDIWMRLLGAVSGSILWLAEYGGETISRLRAEAAIRGIDPQRLVFAPRVPPEEHLARHRLADLFLDTLPYNAHTTAANALWAGVPVITHAGDSFASRVAASLLTAIGLDELVADSFAAYEALALDLAADSLRLRTLRERLQQNRSTAPLFDTDRFRRGIESAYTTMWEMAESGEAPRSFSVKGERAGATFLPSECSKASTSDQ